jgi:hypothetical protein
MCDEWTDEFRFHRHLSDATTESVAATRQSGDPGSESLNGRAVVAVVFLPGEIIDLSKM